MKRCLSLLVLLSLMNCKQKTTEVAAVKKNEAQPVLPTTPELPNPRLYFVQDNAKRGSQIGSLEFQVVEGRLKFINSSMTNIRYESQNSGPDIEGLACINGALYGSSGRNGQSTIYQFKLEGVQSQTQTLEGVAPPEQQWAVVDTAGKEIKNIPNLTYSQAKDQLEGISKKSSLYRFSLPAADSKVIGTAANTSAPGGSDYSQAVARSGSVFLYAVKVANASQIKFMRDGGEPSGVQINGSEDFTAQLFTIFDTFNKISAAFSQPAAPDVMTAAAAQIESRKFEIEAMEFMPAGMIPGRANPILMFAVDGVPFMFTFEMLDDGNGITLAPLPELSFVMGAYVDGRVVATYDVESLAFCPDKALPPSDPVTPPSDPVTPRSDPVTPPDETDNTPPPAIDLALIKTLPQINGQPNATKIPVVIPNDVLTFSVPVFLQTLDGMTLSKFTVVDSYPSNALIFKGCRLAEPTAFTVDCSKQLGGSDGMGTVQFDVSATPSTPPLTAQKDTPLVIIEMNFQVLNQAGFHGIMSNFAEITSATANDTEIFADFDSSFDGNISNDILVDDEINNGGGDEDDHDVESFEVFIQTTDIQEDEEPAQPIGLPAPVQQPYKAFFPIMNNQ